MRSASSTEPPILKSAGVKTNSAPRARISFLRSSLIFSGITIMTL